jgi:predicted DNA-binding transcriptional regulator AlpA
MTDPNRLVKAKDILAAPEVRRLCGIGDEDRHTLKRWRTSRGFPEPIRVLRRKKGQDLLLWDRNDVKKWLSENPPVTNLL